MSADKPSIETTSAGKRFSRWRAGRRTLAQRRAEMPIIDAASASWPDVRRRWPGRAGFIYAWLHVVRPLAVTLFWLLLVRYAWTHLFGLPDVLPIWQQVALYTIAVLVIVLAMLMLAPLRRREVRQEPGGATQPAALEEMSEFAHVGPDALAGLQREQRLVVHHDAAGLMDGADPRAPVPHIRRRPR